MRRPASSPARLLLQLLMTLSLLPYGVPAPASHVVPDTPMPAGHEGHAGTMDPAHHTPMPGDHAADCCDAGNCACGCVAPQAAFWHPETGAHPAMRVPDRATLDDPLRLAGPPGAPFRPPA